MIKIKKGFLAVICVLTYSLTSCASKTQNHTVLFDSRSTLNNWQQVGEGNFVIKNSLLQSVGGMGLLYYTKQKFGNAKIHIVYKVDYKDTNSGVFVRIAHPPKNAWDAVHNGYEIQICDAGKDAFDAYHVTGAVYTFAKANKLTTHAPGKWNDLDIELRGPKITVMINGSKVSEYTTGDPSPKRGRYSDPKKTPRPMYGYIGIQNHDHDAKHPDSHVYFKEITVNPLN